MEKCSVQYLVISESMIKKKKEQTTTNIFLKTAPRQEELPEVPREVFQKTLSSQERTAPRVGQFQYHAQGLEFLTRVPMGNNCITRIQSLRTVPLLLVSQSSFVSAVTCVRTLFHHPLRWGAFIYLWWILGGSHCAFHPRIPLPSNWFFENLCIFELISK